MQVKYVEGKIDGRKVKLINLTPHEVTLVGETATVSIPPSGLVARVKTVQVPVAEAEINGATFPVKESTFTRLYIVDADGNEYSLVEPGEDEVLIVSLIVAQAIASDAKLRDALKGHVLVPDTSPAGAVRDENGRIIGVRGFQTLRELRPDAAPATAGARRRPATA